MLQRKVRFVVYGYLKAVDFFGPCSKSLWGFCCVAHLYIGKLIGLLSKRRLER